MLNCEPSRLFTSVVRQQGRAVFQRQTDRGAIDHRFATGNDLVAAGRRHFHRVGRTALEGHVTGHVQRADGVARRHGTAAFRGQCTDAAVTAEDAAVVDRDRRSQRTIDRQTPLIDQGRAAVGVVAGQHQRADALLGQAAVTGNVVAPGVEAAGDVGAHTLGRFALVDDRADARQVRDKLAGAVGPLNAELLRECPAR